MKRPLRYRTMGAVREGRGNPSPYSILLKIESKNRCFAEAFLRLISIHVRYESTLRHIIKKLTFFNTNYQ